MQGKAGIFMIRKIICCTLTILMVCGMLMFPLKEVQAADVTNDEIEATEDELGQVGDQITQNQEEIDKIKEQNAQLENQIIALQAKVDETQRDLAQKKADLAQTQEEIQQTNADLAEAEQYIADHEQQMDERIASMYKSNTFSYLEMIFEADSLSDFFYKLKISQQVASEDRKALEEYCNKKEEIVELKKQLLVTEAEQTELVKSVDATMTSLNAQIQESETAMNQLEANLQKYETELTNLETFEQELLEELNRLIEEEEQRREEEAAQGSGGYDDEYLEEAGIYPYGYMLWPVENHYLVTSEYGPRDPIPGVTQSTFHGGLDIGGCEGKPVRAAASGTVIQAGYNFNNGNYVVIYHGEGVSTLYAHGKYYPLVQAGQEVRAGEVIMYVGSTGNVTGPHLHFEVSENSRLDLPVNPRNYLGYPDKA